MKWSRMALAGSVAIAAVVGLSGLAPLPAKADPIFISTWVDAPTVGTGSPGECLGVVNGNMTNGTHVVSWTCNGHPDQTWEISGSPGGNTTTIRNSQNTSKCLGVQGSATSDGSILVIWDCNGNTDQNWTFQPWMADNRNGPFGCFTIQNQNAAPKVLGILGGNPTDGAQAVIWDRLTGLGHHDQVWCPELSGQDWRATARRGHDGARPGPRTPVRHP
jgi:hypothetical protein